MKTAQEAWDEANSLETTEAYMRVVEDAINNSLNSGYSCVGIDFDARVSTLIKTKIKDKLEELGYAVNIFPAENRGITFGISWEISDGEDNT